MAGSGREVVLFPNYWKLWSTPQPQQRGYNLHLKTRGHLFLRKMWTGKQWHSSSTFDQISPNIRVCYMRALNQKTLQVWCGRKKTTTKNTNKIWAYQKWIMADEFTFQWQKSNDSLNFYFQWYSISDSIVCWIVWTLLRQSAFKRWAHLGLCTPVLADAGGTCRGQLAHWPVWALPLIQITENHACEIFQVGLWAWPSPGFLLP